MKKTILIIFGIICASVMIVFFIVNFLLFPKKYSDLVTKYCSEFGLEPALVYSIIKAESDFDEGAISKAGSKGLMQLLPVTAEWIASELGENFEEDMLFSPEVNIKYGCYYLNYLMSKFNDIDIVICAYNAGETVVRDWLDDSGKMLEDKITYGETKNYLKKIRIYYQFYEMG